MTVKGLFEALLIELAKESAPPMTLEDFNYFGNKAINLYINKTYNNYDTSLQTTDDLRVLKASQMLDVHKAMDSAYKSLAGYNTGLAKLFGGTYEVYLPDDYLHMLNCVCIYQLLKQHKCYNKGDYVQFPAIRLTADAWSTVMNNLYMRPLPKRPYYYIHNVNISQELPTNPDHTFYKENEETGELEVDWIHYGTDMNGEKYDVATNGEDNINPEGHTEGSYNSNFSRTIDLTTLNGSRTVSTIEREEGYRYGNPSKVRCEIRYGKDDSVFKLVKVLVDYVKTPQYLRLTQEQIDLTEDTSQILEFPDYVCQEIINELVKLVMENNGNARLLNYNAVSQSIAQPQAAQPRQQQ